MTDYLPQSLYQSFEDIYETSDKVNIRLNLHIENTYENPSLFSQPSLNQQQKQSLQIQPFIQFKKSGLLKLYFKIVDFNNPHNTTIINSELELISKSTSEVSVSNSDCYFREVTTGSQSFADDDSYNFEKGTMYLNQNDNSKNILNDQYLSNEQIQQMKTSNKSNRDSTFSCNKQDKSECFKILSKKIKKMDDKQKKRDVSSRNKLENDNLELDSQRTEEKNSVFRNIVNSSKLNKSSSISQESDISREQKNNLNVEIQQTTMNTQLKVNKQYYLNNKSIQQRDESEQYQDLLDSSEKIYQFHNQENQQDCSVNMNEINQISPTKLSKEKSLIDSTFTTRTRRMGSQSSTTLLMLPLVHEQSKTSQTGDHDSNQKQESKLTAGCKGNAVNMAKNILKGFMEYVFESAKEEDFIKCCTNIASNGIESQQQSIEIEEDQNQLLSKKDEMQYNKIETEAQKNEELKLQNLNQTQEMNNEEQQLSHQDEDNEQCDEEKNQKEDQNIQEEAEGQKSVAEFIRKRFRKQYNSKMLEKPSNSKLLKLFSNNNYGKLFQHYFSSNDIVLYIESSNIQNKNAHIELIEKIRGTSYDIEKLQEVLKTRIFKKTIFQKPQK